MEKGKDQQEYRDILRQISSQYNLNSLPTKYIQPCRLDQPNFQVSSEELHADMYEKQTKVYGMPLKDRLAMQSLAYREQAVDQ